MIHTSKQLKDKVRNISHGDNEIAQTMIRCFIMERFLERISLSGYKNNFTQTSHLNKCLCTLKIQ